jgi:cellobiose phosphorylase
VENPAHVYSGTYKVIVDGKEQQGNVVPVFNDAKEHKVIVILG